MPKQAINNNFFLIYIFLWVCIAAIHFVLLAWAWNVFWIAAAIDSLVFNAWFALIGVGLWYWARFSDLQRKRPVELAVNLLTGCMLTVFTWLVGGYWILNGIMPADGSYGQLLENSMPTRAISGVMYYLLLISGFYLINSYRELNERNLREKQMSLLLRDSELNLLRSQINPHFLFNSLNSINTLIMTRPAEASRMLVKLSEFMRYSLNTQDESMIDFKQELYHLELYLDIEKVRFSDRLQVDVMVEANCLEQKVPAMILQPLAENAVKHGVFQSIEKVNIQLHARLHNNQLVVTLSNETGDLHATPKGTGTGLKNVSKRLQMLFGRTDLLKTSNQNNMFVVELTLPVK